MGSKVEYVDSSQVYISNYVRNSKAVGVLWGIFTICYSIIVLVAFVTPEWIGDTSQSENTGRFGLWVRCSLKTSVDIAGVGVEECRGTLMDLSTIPESAFKAATILVAASVIVALVTILAMLLFFFLSSTRVFFICGWLQLLSGLSLAVGIASFPIGWNSEEVRGVCGPSADMFALGDCGIRWASLLAVVGCLDAFILASLAFILASRHIKLQPDHGPLHNGTLYKGKGEMNGGYLPDRESIAGSRKSLAGPVLMMPHADMDGFSDFSHRTGRTKGSAYRPSYPSSMHNFQL